VVIRSSIVSLDSRLEVLHTWGDRPKLESVVDAVEGGSVLSKGV